MPRRTDRAFTLVELLVVIGIIALLIGILLPALNRARQSALDLKCQANLRQMGQGLNLYASMYKGTLPVGFWSLGAGKGYETWDGHLRAVFAKDIASNAGVQQAAGHHLRFGGAFTCPRATVMEGTMHYGGHRLILLDNTGSTSPKWYRLSKAKRSTDVWVITDGAQTLPSTPNSHGMLWGMPGLWKDYGAPIGYGPFWYNTNDTDLNQPMDPGQDRDTDGAGQAQIRWRHGRVADPVRRAANFLFLDGHVEGRSPKDMLNLNNRPDPGY